MPQKNAPPKPARDPTVAEHLGALVERGAAGDRDAHEERELGRRRRGRSASQRAIGDGGARTRHPRRERQRLRRAHERRRRGRGSRRSAGRPARPSAHCSTRPNTIRLMPMRIGSPRLSSMTLVNSAPTSAPGIAVTRSSQASRSSTVVIERVRRRVPRGHDVRPHLVPEVGEHRDQRADVQRDVERLVQRVVRRELGPTEQLGDEDQVAARRDREELGEALNDAEDDGVEDGQAPDARGAPRPRAGPARA